ncbi:hypothetical protein P2W68_08740 [Chryseobacterium arthrosphaerae]|uniref:hypothetical protein n=1 Tax=Chryseobacterium arthrosphaerae TaxID=651561 RepID=UPI0023E12C6F|nr:hypothetical protein [Chryseobacterium arthrosphaerae]WES99700.1 hypothetical protein P2W68_08740 [Chryseobacterium arthrosphaerae]
MKISFTSFLPVLISVSFLIGCKKTTSEPRTENLPRIYDYNVLIVPDLSNRINSEIHPKPLNDTILINNIADNIENLLKIKNRQMNQLDTYRLDFINRGILNQNIADIQKLEINFRRFGNDLQKSSFYKREQLRSDIVQFKKNLSKIYSYSLQNSSGSDVWNYFNQTAGHSIIDEPDTKMAVGNNDTIIKGTRNVIVLLTDGYIESVNNTSGFTLGQQSIKKIRDSYLKSGSTNLEKFIVSKPEYHIKKTSEPLKKTSVLILEMVDRSLDKNGASTVQPTDFEIMKILWTQWLKASGASKTEIYPAFSGKTEVYGVLKKFMEGV